LKKIGQEMVEKLLQKLEFFYFISKFKRFFKNRQNLRLRFKLKKIGPKMVEKLLQKLEFF